MSVIGFNVSLCGTLLLLTILQLNGEVLQPEAQVLLYRERVQASVEILQKRCPDFVKSYHLQDLSHMKRATLPLDVKIELEKAHLARLEELLEICVTNNDAVASHPTTPSISEYSTFIQSGNVMAGNAATNGPVTKIVTHVRTTLTTTVQKTEALESALTPFAAQACKSAINLNEFWRKDNKGQGFLGNHTDYACDTKHLSSIGLPWFRFTGLAGKQLLNFCPPSRSCGSLNGIWSDAQPSYDHLGFPYVFTVYWRHPSIGCWYYSLDMSSIKCAEGDIIYQLRTKSTTCSLAFCGMD